ncbi:MAG: hypothetical protein ACTSRW_05365 [Candidatus Helarchaeota archaeon]
MGRTLPTFRRLLENEIETWKDFRRALRPADQERFDELMNAARKRADAGSYATRMSINEILFACILLELKEEIQELKKKNNG